MNVIPEREVCDLKVELMRMEVEEDKDSMTFITTKRVGYLGRDKESKKNKEIKNKEYKLINNKILVDQTKIKEDKAPKFKLDFKNIICNIKEEIDNNFNYTKVEIGPNYINNKYNNKSDINWLMDKGKSDRIEIGKMNMSKKLHFYCQKEGKKNFDKLNGGKNIGNVTDRTTKQVDKKLKTNREQKEKGNTQMNFYSTELLLKKFQGNNDKMFVYLKDRYNKSIQLNNNNNQYDIKEFGNNKMCLEGNKKEIINTKGIIAKLLVTKKVGKEYNITSNTPTNSTLNSLMKVFKSKKK